jgi:hypothetical protein
MDSRASLSERDLSTQRMLGFHCNEQYPNFGSQNRRIAESQNRRIAESQKKANLSVN